MATVTFLERMRKSYKVAIPASVPYFNERSPHVETDMDGLTGKSFTLGARREVHLRGKVAVCYDVNGVTNKAKPAHITTYFGSAEGAKGY